MMKKTLAVLISATMLVGSLLLVGCGESGNGGEEVSSVDAATNLKESIAMYDEAVANLTTTDNQPLMPEGVSVEVPEIDATPEELEKLDDTEIEKWHYMEYLDWDESQDAEFPESPADGSKGKHIILIVHGAHAWTTCYQEAFKQACEAVGMTYDIYDPNWDQSTQDGYIDQAINEKPDAIVLIPVSSDHSAQQFKKITDAGIPAFSSNCLPTANAMNYIMSYTGPNDWAKVRWLASELGTAMDGKGGVAYITHNVGSSNYYARTFGAVSTLASEYPEIEHLDIQSPGFEATAVKQVVSDWITKYGDKLNAIVLADSADQAIGAVEACKAANRDDIIICASDFSKQGAEFIQGGDVDMLTYQSCQGDAGLAVRTVAEFFNGQTIKRVSYLETDIITKENVDQYLPSQW